MGVGEESHPYAVLPPAGPVLALAWEGLAVLHVLYSEENPDFIMGPNGAPSGTWAPAGKFQSHCCAAWHGEYPWPGIAGQWPACAISKQVGPPLELEEPGLGDSLQWER